MKPEGATERPHIYKLPDCFRRSFNSDEITVSERDLVKWLDGIAAYIRLLENRLADPVPEAASAGEEWKHVGCSFRFAGGDRCCVVAGDHVTSERGHPFTTPSRPEASADDRDLTDVFNRGLCKGDPARTPSRPERGEPRWRSIPMGELDDAPVVRLHRNVWSDGAGVPGEWVQCLGGDECNGIKNFIKVEHRDALLLPGGAAKG